LLSYLTENRKPKTENYFHLKVYPFAALVGQETLKLALILNAINPRLGGVLIRGEKGTAKSTAVRGLAALLPEIKVTADCPYSCDPDHPADRCSECAKASQAPRVRWRRIYMVTLPLNATEDRVVGGIDFNLAVREGRCILQPGLLARAHRGILYVDEVNLLDDHLVDIILDAAASGENLVEREGISFRHRADFILVGTMNPEEGELRPQLLDRFGLCVEVSAETEMAKRVLLMQRREEYDTDPQGFQERFGAESDKIAAQIIKAREVLKTVRISKSLRLFITELCTVNYVAGHRAELVIEQAAKALAAYEQRSQVTIDDIRAVAPLALAHRRRDPLPPPPPPPPEETKEQEDSPHETEAETQEERPPEPQSEPLNLPPAMEEMNPPAPRSDPEESAEGERGDSREQIFEVGATFKVKKIVSPQDRILRRGSGRRSRTRVSLKQGRYVKSTWQRKFNDIAVDATLRAAAPYQGRRKREHDLAVCLRPEDLREKIREKRIGNFLLFLVDASGSMGARGRMVASKGAIMSILLDAYQKRDRVAMISFRKTEAVLNLPSTSSVELAGKLLQEMPVGGRTPLSAGLAKAFEVLRNHLLRDPTSRPIVIIITDGKANVALGEGNPVEEALELASKMALNKRSLIIVIDTEDGGVVSFGLAKQLAMVMQAQYFKTEDLKANELLDIVKGKAQ